MVNIKRFAILVIPMLLGVIALSGCAQAQAGNTPAAVAQNSSANTNTTPAPTSAAIAAQVNDQTISMTTLDLEVQQKLDGIRDVGDPLPADVNAFRMKTLDELIDQVLIEQAAAIQGVKVTDADVESEIQTQITIVGSLDKWKAQLVANHMTEAQYRAQIRSTLITGKMRDIVTASVPTQAEQIHARHILVADEATAKDILNKLKNGADFAQLAAQYSLDRTTQQTGGDLGWFSRGQLLEKTVEDAAFALKDNEISDPPVKSSLGYHVIQTLERVQNRPIDPETRLKMMEDTFESWVQSLWKGAHIVKFPNGSS